MNTILMTLILTTINNIDNKEYRPITHENLYETRNDINNYTKYIYNKPSSFSYSKRTGQPRNRGTNH